MDEVLKLTSLPMVPVIDNFLHLILFFVINQLWWQLLELGPMLFCFFIRGQEQAMEYVMDGPGFWQFKLVSDWGDLPCDFEGAMTFGG